MRWPLIDIVPSLMGGDSYGGARLVSLESLGVEFLLLTALENRPSSTIFIHMDGPPQAHVTS